jgi:hypothetical protein
MIPAMKEFVRIRTMMSVRQSVMASMTTQARVHSSYMIYRQEWVGTPAVPPVAVVDAGVLYMSWNGATGITSWKIFAGNTEDKLEPIGSVKNMGFETTFRLQNGHGLFVKAAAYRDGGLLKSTNVVAVAQS